MIYLCISPLRLTKSLLEKVKQCREKSPALTGSLEQCKVLEGCDIEKMGLQKAGWCSQVVNNNCMRSAATSRGSGNDPLLLPLPPAGHMQYVHILWPYLTKWCNCIAKFGHCHKKSVCLYLTWVHCDKIVEARIRQFSLKRC